MGEKRGVIPRPRTYALHCTGMLFLAFLMGSAASHAQFLSNIQFDTDVSGWTRMSASATVEWDPLDAEASLASGSSLVTNIADVAGDNSGAYQCAVGINEGNTYLVGAEIYIPGAQTETGWADILVGWFADADCSDDLGFALTSTVLTATPDTWLPVIGLLVAPAGSQSARIRLDVRKREDSGSLVAHFDNVLFVSAPFFTDGFESGDTSAWSSTQ